jgi:hypothetical protein
VKQIPFICERATITLKSKKVATAAALVGVKISSKARKGRL